MNSYRVCDSYFALAAIRIMLEAEHRKGKLSRLSEVEQDLLQRDYERTLEELERAERQATALYGFLKGRLR